MTTETFREEHYEVEEKQHSGEWWSLGGYYPTTNEAQQVADHMGNKSKRPFRIIRCTTIREVVE